MASYCYKEGMITMCERCAKYEDALSKMYDYNKELRIYIERLEYLIHDMKLKFETEVKDHKPRQPFTLKDMVNL